MLIPFPKRFSTICENIKNMESERKKSINLEQKPFVSVFFRI